MFWMKPLFRLSHNNALSVYLDATNRDEPRYRKNILNVEDQGSDLSVLYILWLTLDTALF